VIIGTGGREMAMLFCIELKNICYNCSRYLLCVDRL
jgi:hypothetical protein